jgi:hypothetical protein
MASTSPEDSSLDMDRPLATAFERDRAQRGLLCLRRWKTQVSLVQIVDLRLNADGGKTSRHRGCFGCQRERNRHGNFEDQTHPSNGKPCCERDCMRTASSSESKDRRFVCRVRAFLCLVCEVRLRFPRFGSEERAWYQCPSTWRVELRDQNPSTFVTFTFRYRSPGQIEAHLTIAPTDVTQNS